MKRPLAILATVVAPHLFTGAAHASERDGVSCPTGSDASVSNGVLTCSEVVYLWPVGMPMQSTVGHDPKQGVACPSGVSTVVLAGRRGLRCIDTEVHKAGCDAVNPLNLLSPWTVERRTGRDLCVSKDITGNRVVGQYTIPINAGYVGAMGNPAQHGWTLDTDRTGHGNVDYWLKNGTVYKYPAAR